MKKFVLFVSNLLVCFATVVAIAPCFSRSYEPPMPEALRKQLMD